MREMTREISILDMPACCRGRYSDTDSEYSPDSWRAYTCSDCGSSWRGTANPDFFVVVGTPARARVHALIDQIAAAAHKAVEDPKNVEKGDSWDELSPHWLRFRMWEEIGEAREEQTGGDAEGMIREYGDALVFEAMSVDNERSE